MLTQAPPNTGAGWYSLATGAWPGVHGSTNNTFHINGQPFGNRTAAFDPNVLQAETIAQSAERGGLKVAQVEWAGGATPPINGPDDRLPVVLLGPRRGHELHRLAGRLRRRGVHRRVRPAVRPPGGLRRPAAVPGAAPAPATGWTNVPASYSPAQGDAPARDRLRHRQVRPQRLHLRHHNDSTDRTTTRCCSRRRRTAPTRSASCARASGPTSRSRSSAAPSTARPPACWSRSRS